MTRNLISLQGRRYRPFLIAVAALCGCDGSGTHASASPPKPAAPCRALAPSADAGAAIAACLAATPPGGTVALAPGRYVLRAPLRIDRPVTIRTANVAASTPACEPGGTRCATIVLRIGREARFPNVPPIEIASDGVTLDHLAIEGSRTGDPDAARALCLDESRRALAGGVRVRGDRVTITNTAFHDIACYTAVEYAGGADGRIVGSVFARNGTHDVEGMWSDGLTVHDARRLLVRGNRFVDNTDVQMIFGGCRDCRVLGNRLRHSGSRAGGAFADLMLHAWPNSTSGDFTGTRVSGNTIDCTAARRCGFGIMIGAAPWYQAPTFGGAVTGNSVRGAMLALNVDGLTGPMVIAGNDLAPNRGLYDSSCGKRAVERGAINVAPGSGKHLRGGESEQKTAVTYRSCILNYDVQPR